MNWTKDLPKESGFYWYREPVCCSKELGDPRVIEWDANDQVLTYCGCELMHFADGSSDVFTVEGEFWPERLIAP